MPCRAAAAGDLPIALTARPGGSIQCSLPARVVLHDSVVTTAASTKPAPTPEAEAKAAAQAAAIAAAAQMIRHEALRWLTTEQITTLGQQVTASIDRYQQHHRRSPTWADALAGIDPTLLTPIQTIPDGFPLRPALWRLELRQRLMIELRRTRWITYTRTTRSLHPGDQGRGWLSTQHQDHDTPVTKPAARPAVVPPRTSTAATSNQ